MKMPVSQKLYRLACYLNKPLYIVGGYVRNFLAYNFISCDIDLCAPIKAEDLTIALNKFGFKIKAEYKRTGTIVFFEGNQKYEFTSFRSESYCSHKHTPDEIAFTEDILVDALRRDFSVNALYYDIKNDMVIDPLGFGLRDLKEHTLNTVDSPLKVFSEDGLRLMRLARFSGELNFIPKPKVIESAKQYSKNINSISVERIYEELKAILVADTKYPFSKSDGHYFALKILDEIGVLDNILGELTLGRNMEQRKDFHKYDVLEHSLRCVLYADKNIRLSALLHDIGKPFAMQKDGKYHNHAIYGEEIAKNVLDRLKVDTKTKEKVCFLTKAHMLDLKEDMGEGKLRRFIVKNNDYLEDLIKLKIADFKACMDSDKIPSSVLRWQAIRKKMKGDGTPFSLKELKISASDLMNLGFKNKAIGEELNRLLYLAVDNPKINEFDRLIDIAKLDFEKSNKV